MKWIFVTTAIFATVFFTLAVSAQHRFRVGDRVEIRSAGDVKPGVVVEGYRDTEFGYGTYKVHLDGEKYCNDHVLDTRIDSKFVFLVSGKTTPAVKAKIPEKSYPPVPTRRRPAESSGGKYKPGDGIFYNDSNPVWLSGAWIVSYNPETRRYSLMDKSGSGTTVACHSVHRPGDEIDNDFFVGKWDVRIVGSIATVTKNGDLYRRYDGRGRVAPLEVYPNGTYVWRSVDGKTIRGQWTPRGKVPGITLLGAENGLNLTIFEKTASNPADKNTRDEIGFFDLDAGSGGFEAYRIGANKSCVLKNRF